MNLNAVALHRIAHWLYRHRIPVLPQVIYLLIFLLYNSSIPASCEIGKGTKFGYGGIAVVLHPRCRIGERVAFAQDVTVGGSSGKGVPVIGKNVFLGRTRVLGGVTIGDNVVIGANAVVLDDIPSNSVAFGIPARVRRQIPNGGLDALAGVLLREEAGHPDRSATEADLAPPI